MTTVLAVVKPHIFLDFDGLLFDSIPGYVQFINESYGIHSKLDDYSNNCPPHEVIKKYRPDFSMSSYEVWLHTCQYWHMSESRQFKVPPILGACDAVAKLAQKYRLSVVTSRPRNSLPVIYKLLTKHFNWSYVNGIHCAYNFVGNDIIHVSKKDFIISVVGEKIAFIDDSKGEIIEMGDTVPSFLFDPRGLYINDKVIINRVSSWKEIELILM